MATLIVRIRDRAIVEFCFEKHMTAVQCFDEITAVYGEEGPSKSTIYSYYEQLRKKTFSYVDPVPVRRTQNEILIQRIKVLIDSDPFLSLRKIAEEVDSSKDTVRRILIAQLGLKKLHSRWIPHMLTGTQKKVRVERAREMLEILRVHEKTEFRDVITGDESWFLYSYPFGSYWGKSAEPRKEIPRSGFQTPKSMLVLCWGVRSVPVSTFPQKGKTMTASLFQETVVNPLISLNETLPENQKLLVHWDNAPAHTAKSTKAVIERSGLAVLQQPPYSPDLAPCDFFLFGYLKCHLRGKKCDTPESLLTEITSIMNGITTRRRIHVFQGWMFRLQSVIDAGGEYCK
jgi:histone-lysine N-methyltransferase SETMAR